MGWVARPGGAEAGIVPAGSKDLCDGAALIGADASVGNENAADAVADAADADAADANDGSACA